MDRERFEPVARYANAALWGTYGLGIVSRLADDGKQGRRLALSPDDEHRLSLLESFFDSARRGGLPVSQLREERQRIQSLDPSGGEGSRQRISFSSDLEAFTLLTRLIPPIGSGGHDGISQDELADWVDRALTALASLRAGSWRQVDKDQRDFIRRQLLPVLSQLAALTRPTDYEHRGSWHVVAV